VCACVCVCPFLSLSPSFSLSLPAVSSLCFPVSLSISPLLSLSLSLVPSLFARACIYFYAKMLCPAYILLVIACRVSCVCLCTVRQHPYMPHHTYERVQTYTLIFHSSRNISPKTQRCYRTYWLSGCRWSCWIHWAPWPYWSYRLATERKRQ